MNMLPKDIYTVYLLGIKFIQDVAELTECKTKPYTCKHELFDTPVLEL
jgi:hypothetical protein